jgi:hypothetical protein
MATETQTKPSFSPYRRWGIALQVGFMIFLVFSVMVMVNYLSREHYTRLHLTAGTRMPLSPRTTRFLESLTNHVAVTVFYDKDDSMFHTVMDLLKEYQLANSRISLQVVDYNRDPGTAQQLKLKYPVLASPNARNVILFDCDGRVKAVDGKALAKYVVEQIPNESEIELRKKPTAFEGERAFTSTLAGVVNAKPLNAYFLRGHGEHEFDSADEGLGYIKLATVLRENYITNQPLSLLSTNVVPADCNLLVIAGPTTTFDDSELEKIDQYLAQGGRLLALFNALSLRNGETGLEKVLAKWGVDVTSNIVVDPEQTTSQGADAFVGTFSSHPIVNPLMLSAVRMNLPRWIGRLRKLASPPADAPRVEELAFTGPHAYIRGQEARGQRAFPVAVAVEKGAIKNVVSERGATRIVVAGDSIFLANHQIDLFANRDFAWNAINWLLDRPQLMAGIGPRPVNQHTILLTQTQWREAEWILLGAMPGGALLLGGLVWMRRRK